MRLGKVLFLAGYTPRSQAYLQALVRVGLYPENILLFGKQEGGLSGQAKIMDSSNNEYSLFIPDFSESLLDTVRKIAPKLYKISSGSINDFSIYHYIRQIKPSLIIYSGYGGQIVGKKLLETGIPFLHMHAGWLPEYPGSTTLYYSWLKDNFCAVSAILLNEKIDRGVIVGRKKYPPPAKDIDPDCIYDSVIRADFLVLIIKAYVKAKRFTEAIPQSEDLTLYYVIHPVLKHLARLRGETKNN